MVVVCFSWVEIFAKHKFIVQNNLVTRVLSYLWWESEPGNKGSAELFKVQNDCFGLFLTTLTKSILTQWSF